MIVILPSYYTEWLNSIDTAEAVCYRGSEFYLLSESELADEITIDKNTVNTFNQLYAFIKTQLEVSGSSPLTIEQCSTCITIGTDNGNPVFIDLMRDSDLFCYYLDGGYIEAKGGNLLSLSMEAIIDET
ncbi:hypothetical protein [Shewanella sp.]|uniref:hypothetical protein n=1 Tax=Shewanella sp. TaxID=50422 RepID=UPI002580293F|nr:hypothetical protein [Shewanella sp.]